MAEKHPDTEWLFGGEDNRNSWEAHRRFISPTFNAIYRQGVIGPSHLPEVEFGQFLAEARTDVARAAAQLRTWVDTTRVQGGDFGDLAIDRLVARAAELDADIALGVTRVFAEFMDEYYRLRPKAELLVDTWQKSEIILRTFARSVDEYQFTNIANTIAEKSQALSWMTCSIGRMELWSHGLAGNRPKEEDVRLLTAPDLQAFLSILLGRISKLDTHEILSLPNLLPLLLTFTESPWHKTKIKTVLRRFVGLRSSDETFIGFLEATAGLIISSNRGAFRQISKSTLHHLVGEATFEPRWAALNSKSLSPEANARVTNIKRMMEEAENY